MSDLSSGQPLGPVRNTSYWQRELTPNGQKINDMVDSHAEASARRILAPASPSVLQKELDATWKLAAQEKAQWRDELKRTGTLVTPYERQERQYHAQQEAAARNAAREAVRKVAQPASVSAGHLRLASSSQTKGMTP